ncbi:MAG TPA: type II toxin-antitoxin system RelE/ParE family toxin [Allosphingosinicella sp.]|nr:type II toxin-antitoxin system RelE/ParE family toxin [Allosphingosinicella sp.]
MSWKLEFHPDAVRELKKLDRRLAARIVRTLETRIAVRDDPRTLGAPLKGEHEGYWRWRIGDYRVIALIEADRIRILVVRIAHRREAYR